MSKTRKQRGMKPDRPRLDPLVPFPLSDAQVRKALMEQMFRGWDRAVEWERTRPRKPWEKR